MGVVTLLPGGWVALSGPDMPEGFAVEVRAEMLDGEPRVVGLRMAPTSTPRRMRRETLTGLDLEALGEYAYAARRLDAGTL